MAMCMYCRWGPRAEGLTLGSLWLPGRRARGGRVDSHWYRAVHRGALVPRSCEHLRAAPSSWYTAPHDSAPRTGLVR
ncbi:hypothetical protein C8Q72DRAFT_845623 [Fomitopsis betulina]|nr:hypothetical protein C8Q72DRAFT_845623 [Fomitopsis betulina]